MAKLCDHYQEQLPDREPYVNRARVFAALTIPSIMPPEGTNGAHNLPQSYQSLGARGANNLAAKLLMSFLPPGASAFRIGVPAKALIEAGTMSTPPEIAKKLALVEQLITDKIEKLGWRRPTFITALSLIITGNIAERILDDGRIKQYRLDQFVCSRDGDSGELLDITTHERMRARNLPAELRGLCAAKKDEEFCDIYTRFEKVDSNHYAVQQDIDQATAKPRQVFAGKMPINALRWSAVPGEDYGRSHVEDNFGDLNALDEDCKNLTEGGALAARHLTFVKPNAAGGNLRKRILQARNGAVISGNREDVGEFQFNVGNGLVVVQTEVERLTRALSASFLLTSDLRRDAERVTAYELRMLATELETALGGTYSLLSVELLAWRLALLIERMKRDKELPEFEEDEIDLTITTGLDALGRDETVNRVRSAYDLVAAARQASSEEAIDDYVKHDELLTPGLAALGFPSAVRSAQEVDERRAARQEAELEAQLAAAAAPPIAQAAAAPQGQ